MSKAAGKHPGSRVPVRLVPLNDEACIDIGDLHDRQELAEELAAAIATCRPPQVFGLHGDWGSGKTSFLMYLRYVLTGEQSSRDSEEALPSRSNQFPHVTSVWFEAWRHQDEPAPIIALLHEMRAQLEAKKSFLAQQFDIAEIEARKLIDSALLALESITAKFTLKLGPVGFELGGTAPKYSQASQAYDSANFLVPMTTQVLRQHLENVLDQLLPKKNTGTISRRLVIFVDDLDRCDASAAFRLLEAIKIYLNLPNCVFVLGLNRREITRAIASALPLKGEDGSSNSELLVRAQEYTEKLCGHFVGLPFLAPQHQQDLLDRWLKDATEKEFRQAMVALAQEHRFLPANARRIKAFCNVTRLVMAPRLRKLLDGENLPTREAAVVAILASLRAFHPDVFEVVEADVRFYQILREFAMGTDGTLLRSDGTRSDPRHPSFIPLRLPLGKVLVGSGSNAVVDAASGSAPTPGSESQTIVSLYADATSINVLHCQSLIARTPLTDSDLLAYLRS